MNRGAIILCGGKSSRMGRDKATLPFGPEAMLQRVVRLVGETVPATHTVVVGAANQALPTLPAPIIVARDNVEYCGPLAGIAIGLRTLAERGIDAAFVIGCDAPLVEPKFIVRLFAQLGEHDAAVPYTADHEYPLAAVYRPNVLPQIEQMIAAERFRVRDLLTEINTRRVPADELRSVDPDLRSLCNVNSEAEYREALRLVENIP